MNRFSTILLALLLFFSSATAQSVLESTVPGDLLGWETDELNVTISVLEQTEVKLEVFSPAFDPDDYRASLDGRFELGDERYDGFELGDERYDGGEGALQSLFRMSRNGEVMFERTYGVAPHATEVIFEGVLAPGEYQLHSSFQGLGKNSFVYTLQSSPVAAVYFDAGETLLFNIRGQEFQRVLTVHVTEGDVPADFWIYDGDGYDELRGRLEGPSGNIELPISGDLEWSRIRLGQAGTYHFSFYQPEGAYQHSNTIGIRTDARLRGTPEGLRFTRTAPVLVRIIDTSGNLIPGTYAIEQEGHIRTAVLTGLPEDYVYVETRTEGGVIETPERVRFGPEGGVAIFVAERLPAPPTLLTVTASLEYPGFEGPWPLEFMLNGEAYTLTDGEPLTLEVQPALHVVRSVPVTGATVTDGYSLPIRAGEHAHAHFVVRPVVQLDLTVDIHERYVGEGFVFTTTATTEFAQALPGELELILPPGLYTDGPLRLAGVISQGEPLVMTTPATGVETGLYEALAWLDPWDLTDREFVRVIAPEPEPVTEPEPDPEPVVEPDPDPEPVALPEPTLPDFAMSRVSTVHVDFQASQVAYCELPLLEAGSSLTLGLGLRVVDDAAWQPAVVLPSADPAESLSVYVQDVQRSGDAANMTVVVRNYGSAAVAGSVLVPLPLGAQLAGRECATGSALGEELLVSHTIPEGGDYLPGSSRLDGEPFSEPRQVERELIWRLPYSETGTISYGVSHEAALGELAEPSLTVVLGEREHLLVGELSAADFDAAGTVQKGLVREPAAGSSFVASEGTELVIASDDPVTVRVNGAEVEVSGERNEDGHLVVPVALDRGSNLISVSSSGAGASLIVHGAGEPAAMHFEPVRLVADGRNTLLVDVVVTDADGVAVGSGEVSVGANTGFATDDPTELISGWQVQLENGRGRIELEPAGTPFALELEAVYFELEATDSLQVLGTRSGLWQAMASVTARVTGGFALDGVVRGYLELPVGESGTLQAAVDVAGDLRGLDLERSLSTDPDPTDRFPLTGAGNEARPTLRSSDGFAVLYTDEGLSAGYLEATATVPGVSGLPTLTGLHASFEFAEGWTAQGFAALTSTGMRQQTIVPDGTRRYSLGEAVRRGSETVTLVVGDDETVLRRDVDYVLDEALGAFTLVQPLWPLDPDMNEVRLRIDYAPLAAPRDRVDGGLGVRYESEDLEVALGAAISAAGTRAGFSVAWSFDALTVNAQLGLTFAADVTHTGRLSVAYALSETSRLQLAHSTGTRANRTSLSYTHEFFVDEAVLGLSAGVSYAWESARFGALAGLSYQQGAFHATLDHEQGLAADTRSTSTAGINYRLNDNLTARATFKLVWGNSLDGTIGLVQRVGNAELDLSYQLPTASGRGNLARFGVRAPFRLTDNLSLDLHAGLSRALASGETETGGGLALRYRNESLVATLGGEVAHNSASGFKVVFRAGASGQLSVDQNLAFDANYQVLPTVEGRLSLAYSLKRGPLNLLTYHRLLNRASGSVLEGELAPTLNFSNRLQLRPNLAYRLLLDDPAGNAYQASLFAIGYFDPNFGDSDLLLGAGLGGHALWQPGTSSVSYGWSAELQARIVPEVWFGIGYTFGGYRGLTADTAGGLYVRLDLVGGGQF